ncbi:MAG: hypothetical protein RSG77_16995 [Hafnia sp.]
MKTIGAAVINDQNHILPYTCKTYIQQVEEAMAENPAWEKLKELGARVEQVYITTADEQHANEQAFAQAMALIKEMTMVMMSSESGFREPSYTEMTDWARRVTEFLHEQAPEEVPATQPAPTEAPSQGFNPTVQGMLWYERGNEFNGYQGRPRIGFNQPAPINGPFDKLCAISEARRYIEQHTVNMVPLNNTTDLIDDEIYIVYGCWPREVGFTETPRYFWHLAKWKAKDNVFYSAVIKDNVHNCERFPAYVCRTPMAELAILPSATPKA